MALSRRQALSGLAAAPAVLVAPSVVIAASVPETAAWDAAMADYLKAKAEDDAFDPVYHATHKAYTAAKPDADAFKIADSSLRFYDKRYILYGLDLEKHTADFLAGENKLWWGKSVKPDFLAEMDRIRAFRQATQAADDATGYSRANDRYDELVDRTSEAADALIAIPAPHAEALQWKLHYLFGDMASDENSIPCFNNEYLRPVFNDIRRLTGGAA